MGCIAPPQLDLAEILGGIVDAAALTRSRIQPPLQNRPAPTTHCIVGLACDREPRLPRC